MAHMHTPATGTNLDWDPKVIMSKQTTAIAQVVSTFNAADYHELTGVLRQQITRDNQTGIAYALLRTPDDSEHMAVMHFNPFGNGLTSKMLLRAELCRRVFRAAGVKDESGKYLPVLTCSSPQAQSSLRLKRHHRKAISKGLFEPVALQHLKLAQSFGFRQLHFIGFSQGASLATSTAAAAHKQGWPIGRLVVGDPVNLLARSRLELIRVFYAEYPQLRHIFNSTSINAIKTAHNEERIWRTFMGVLRRGRINYALAGGLATNSFETDLQYLAGTESSITMGHGSNSRISPFNVLGPLVDAANTTTQLPIQLITVDNSTHGWGEHIDLLAVFYAYGLMR